MSQSPSHSVGTTSLNLILAANDLAVFHMEKHEFQHAAHGLSNAVTMLKRSMLHGGEENQRGAMSVLPPRAFNRRSAPLQVSRSQSKSTAPRTSVEPQANHQPTTNGASRQCSHPKHFFLLHVEPVRPGDAGVPLRLNRHVLRDGNTVVHPIKLQEASPGGQLAIESKYASAILLHNLGISFQCTALSCHGAAAAGKTLARAYGLLLMSHDVLAKALAKCNTEDHENVSRLLHTVLLVLQSIGLVVSALSRYVVVLPESLRRVDFVQQEEAILQRRVRLSALVRDLDLLYLHDNEAPKTLAPAA